jgi:hypothetical protein
MVSFMSFGGLDDMLVGLIIRTVGVALLAAFLVVTLRLSVRP